MRRTILIYGLSALGLTLVLILAAAMLSRGPSPSATTGSTTNVSTKASTDATAIAKSEVEIDHTAEPGISSVEDIPVYGDADLTNRFCRQPADKCTLELQTDAPAREVEAFYRKLLTDAGWSLLDELVTAHGVELYYARVVNTATPPLRYYVRVHAVRIDEPSTFLSLSFERWPDARELPIPPDAQQVTVEWYTQSYGFIERITRFVTKAAPTEVEAYYKDVMSQQGWMYRAYEPPHNLAPDRPGIDFYYSRTSRTVRLLGGVVTLFTDLKEGGLTQVELRAQGTDIEELWNQQHESEY